MSDYDLKTINDFEGPVSDLIKIARACEKAGINVKSFINTLRRPDKKEVLKEINEYFLRKSESQQKIETVKKEEKVGDYKYNKRPDFSDLLY